MNAICSQADFARALSDPELPPPSWLTTARGQLDPARLAVYRNNVHVSLVSALERSFPIVRRVVGERFFAATARVFVAGNKPKNPVLANYGESFAGFLSGFPPAGQLPYLPDLARLEFAWLTAYHAAEAAPLDPGILQEVDPNRLATQNLQLHPATRLLQSDFPVGSIWVAHQRDPLLPVKQSAAETVVITRSDAQMRVTIIPQPDIPFVRALFDGAPVGEAFELAIRSDSRFDFGTALLGLARLGVFAAPEPGDRPR
jgi:hypothetical protein